MSHYIYVAIALIIIAWLAWRWYSTKHNLPCPAWLSWMVELDNPFARAHKASEIIASLPLNHGMKVLDIGCGPGRVLVPLAQKIAQVNGHATGLDVQAEMLQKASLKAQKLHVNNVDFIKGNIDQVPLEQHYDVVLMICVLGEIPGAQHESVMRKVAAHVKPDGIISITETVFDPHFQKRKNVACLMERVGFTQVKQVGNWFAYTAHFKKKHI